MKFCVKFYQIKYNLKLIVVTQLHLFFLKQQLNKPFLHCRHKTTCQSHSTYLKHKTMLFLLAYIEYTEIGSHTVQRCSQTHQLYATKQLSLEVYTPCQSPDSLISITYYIVGEMYANLPVERMLLVIASARPTFSSFFGLAEKTG